MHVPPFWHCKVQEDDVTGVSAMAKRAETNKIEIRRSTMAGAGRGRTQRIDMADVAMVGGIFRFSKTNFLALCALYGRVCVCATPSVSDTQISTRSAFVEWSVRWEVGKKVCQAGARHSPAGSRETGTEGTNNE